MVNWPAVTAVFSVYCAGVIIPGPNFVAVAHKAVSATTAHALMLVGGIVVVNLFWATCAILGIGAVFSLLPWLAFVVKCLGAGYLVWFGMRLIFASGKPPALNARARPDAQPAKRLQTGRRNQHRQPQVSRVLRRDLFRCRTQPCRV